MHGAGGGAPEGKRNGNFRHGGRAKDANDASRYVNELVSLVTRHRSMMSLAADGLEVIVNIWSIFCDSSRKCFSYRDGTDEC
jgi:hypothetical protein